MKKLFFLLILGSVLSSFAYSQEEFQMKNDDTTIFNVKNYEEAEKLESLDPSYQAGRLVMEIYPGGEPKILYYNNMI